jgi:circadian clock protein KaiB
VQLLPRHRARAPRLQVHTRIAGDEFLRGKYRVEVVDLLKNPQLAAGDQIVAIPTLVRRLPQPLKKIVGDLSNSQQVIVGLDLQQKRINP